MFSRLRWSSDSYVPDHQVKVLEAERTPVLQRIVEYARNLQHCVVEQLAGERGGIKQSDRDAARARAAYVDRDLEHRHEQRQGFSQGLSM